MADTIAGAVTGAARLVEALELLGVELVFGLPGVHNLPVFERLQGSAIRLVGVRHEQAAAYAADGYARASGRLGVALVTTGPGAANALGAIGEAMASGSAVLLIATDIPASLRRPGVYRGVLHETRDQTGMFASVTKARRRTEGAAAIGPGVLEGAAAALAAPSGPVYLGVPTDELRQPAPPLVAAAPPAARRDRTQAATDTAAAALLATARRPLIWAGGGALRAGAGAAVGALGVALAAPILTTYQARGLVPVDHPCVVPAPVHVPAVGVLWDEADLVVAVGTDFDAMMTQNWRMPQPPKLLAVNIDEQDATKNYRADVTLVGDAREVLERLVPQIAPRAGIEELRQRLAGIAVAVAAAVAVDEPQAAAFLDVLQRVLPPEAVVVADMCIPGYWLAGFRRVPLPRKLAYPVGWGTLGFGFPASLGSALAGAGPAVCVTGDGGFLFACGELATVAEAEIPLTVILVDDGGYGMLRFDQQHAGAEPFGVDLVGPDFAALAQSFGIGATTVDGFGPAFERALRASLDGASAHVIVVNARLKPPPTTSPRWYRR